MAYEAEKMKKYVAVTFFLQDSPPEGASLAHFIRAFAQYPHSHITTQMN